MTRAHRELVEDNARMRDRLRACGISDEELAFAAREDTLDSALTSNAKLASCVEGWERREAHRRSTPDNKPMTSANDPLQADLNQALADNQHAHRSLALIGKNRPAPRLTGNTEQDLAAVRADTANLSADLIAFAPAIAALSHASVVAGSGATRPGMDGSAAGRSSVNAAAEEPFAYTALSPAQASLLSQWQVVEKDLRQRSEFIQAHKKELLELALVLDRVGSVAQAEAAPDAARPGATASDDDLIKQYRAVEHDPVARSLFVRQHHGEIQAWLLRQNSNS